MEQLILRQAAIDAATSSTMEWDGMYVQDLNGRIREAIEQLPPIQPRRGKWIKTARWSRVYYCDQCRNYLDFDGVNAGRGSTNYCPNCGAKMEVTT